MEGVVELAEEIFHMPVRLGAPQNIRGLSDIVNNPIYSTGVGLLFYGMKQQEGRSMQMQRNQGATWWTKAKAWLAENF